MDNPRHEQQDLSHFGISLPRQHVERGAADDEGDAEANPGHKSELRLLSQMASPAKGLKEIVARPI